MHPQRAAINRSCRHPPSMLHSPTVTTGVSWSAGMSVGPPTAITRNLNCPGAPPVVSWLQVMDGWGGLKGMREARLAPRSLPGDQAAELLLVECGLH